MSLRGPISLTDQDYRVIELPDGRKRLTIGVRGPTLVYYYSRVCEGCKKFTPEYIQHVAPRAQQVNIAMCNPRLNNDTVARMSQGTNTPIQYVPYFVLYIDGMPIMEYNLEKSASAILKFLEDIVPHADSNGYQPPNSGSINPAVSKDSDGGMSYYGKCKNEGSVCYLNMDQAYPEMGRSGECAPGDEVCTRLTMDQAYPGTSSAPSQEPSYAPPPNSYGGVSPYGQMPQTPQYPSPQPPHQPYGQMPQPPQYPSPQPPYHPHQQPYPPPQQYGQPQQPSYPSYGR